MEKSDVVVDIMVTVSVAAVAGVILIVLGYLSHAIFGTQFDIITHFITGTIGGAVGANVRPTLRRIRGR